MMARSETIIRLYQTHLKVADCCSLPRPPIAGRAASFSRCARGLGACGFLRRLFN